MTNVDLKTMTADGTLRAAVNLGNGALARRDGKTLTGPSPALAARLAAYLGATLVPVVYEGAGKVFADAEADVWDVAFLAIDATRAELVSFTRPYLQIEATYAVRADSDLVDVGEADQLERVLLVARGSAYDYHLTGAIKAATIVRADSPSSSMERFRAGEGDMVAGVRQSLEQAFAGNADIRILPGRFTAIEQAMVLPGKAHPALEALDAFLAEAIADGVVAAHLFPAAA